MSAQTGIHTSACWVTEMLGLADRSWARRQLGLWLYGFDPDLKAAVEGKAASEHTPASEIIRRALHRYLDDVA